MQSNCFVYALFKYWRCGGYLAIRKSRMGSIFPHFIWIKDLKDAEIEHFVPSHPKRVIVPPPVFKGYVKTDDVA